MHTPLISVLIPTCSRNEELAVCLERLAPGKQVGMKMVWTQGDQKGAQIDAPSTDSSYLEPVAKTVQPFGPFTYEVIVSDDGRQTTAESLIRERFPWVTWALGPGRGPAANRNSGARHARGKWLAFTDDDCVLDERWLSGFAGKVAGVGDVSAWVLEGKTIPIGPKKHPLDDAPINETGGLLWSCNFCILRSLFDEIGGFDERFPYAAMEDVDLRLRLENHGVQPLFVPVSIVSHPWKSPDLRRHWRRHLKSLMIFLKLHPEQGRHFTFRYQLGVMARYYRRDFLRELRVFGLKSLLSQPLRCYGYLLYAWTFWRRPEPQLKNT